MNMSAEGVLVQTEHRPWALPEGRWAMTQTWHELLFAHWRVPAAALRPLIPAALEIDTYEGEAWLGVVPFRMSNVRPRLLPAVPGLSFFPELNVRTYVTDGEKAGVWFFSLEAANPIAVAIARRWFNLPYFNADMRCDYQAGELYGHVDYESVRTHRGVPGAVFRGTYGPTSDVYRAERGSLEQWLTERYCLYARDGQGRLHRGEIQHVPWPLQRAEADIRANTMAESHGLKLPDEAPLLHYAHEIEVLVWALERVEK